MIILDTNVISEPLKPSPNAHVMRWLDEQLSSELFITATSKAELLVGVMRLPDGQRRRTLRAGLQRLLDELFANRILPFDGACAEHFAVIVANSQARGVTISFADATIAATASLYNGAVATRDRGPFEASGVMVIDPWADR